ncbi:MAG TPA: hypothetical protein VKX25_19100 [Bryobacteraceae bacterium]|nr:hypothetical protein [Bryobacteraceae bacterium]
MRAVLILALAWPLSAFQYPGQQPPIGYPPGQGPGSGGISLPSRGHKNKQKESQMPTIEADGLVVSNDGKKLVVDVPDGRTLTMTINAATKWVKNGSNLQPGEFTQRAKVHVVAAEDDESFLTAVSVNWLAEPPNGQTSVAAAIPSDEDMAKPTILKTPDAPDRPILRRGKPASEDENSGNEAKNSATTGESKAASKKDSDSIDFTIEDESKAPKRANAYDELIGRAREWSQTFTNGLPNFLCQQNTTRYVEQSKSEGFQPVDVVTAKVLYEDGQEKYSEITVGGKRTNKSMMEIGGSTSTGEFASVLAGLFQPITHAQFKFVQSTTVNREPAAIYDFNVPLQHSNWTIQVGGQTLRPAYSGSIWVKKATAEVLRIEMQADNVPKDFPDDTIASAVDWDSVPLGTAKFLLPVHAENLSCQRGSTICSKNAIDFRDYHKYEGESTIEFK